MHFYVQIRFNQGLITDTSEKYSEELEQKIKKKRRHSVFVDEGGRRIRCHGNQSLSSPSSTFPRFSLFLMPLSSSSNVLTTGCIPPLPRASTVLCLLPKRPMGLTPRPTYQKGSISGPGHQTKDPYAGRQWQSQKTE